MGKALLFLVATTTLTSGVLLYSGIQRSVFQAAEQLSEQEAQVVARQVALTAMSEARTTFLADPDGLSGSVTYSGSYEGGSFETTFVPELGTEESSVRIRVEGRMPHGGGKTATHTIETTYRLSGEGGSVSPPQQVPSFMSYGILTNGTLTMNGSINVYGSPTVNANIHTNANIQINGNNSVEGFGSYVGNAHSNPAQRLYTTFDPAVNPDNLPTVFRTNRVEIPRFKAQDHRHLATKTHQGNLILNGNDFVQLGTRENPDIWYVSGDLIVNGGVTLSGYATFLVNGNVVLNGGVSTTGGVGEESNVGFYASGDLNMNGSVTVHGQFLAGQNVNFNGRTRLYGSLTTGGLVNWNGNPSVYYREASPVLTEPIWPSEPTPGEQAWRTATYREWASID